MESAAVSTPSVPAKSSPFARLWKRKGLDELSGDAERESGLAKSLGPIELICLGIGAIIGAGIFLTVGTAAAGQVENGVIVRYGAGPAIIVSFLVTAVV